MAASTSLARAGDLGRPRTVDLAELAHRHGETWRPVFARAGRALQVEATPALPARVSPGGVAQALDVLDLRYVRRHGEHICGSDARYSSNLRCSIV